MHNRQFSYCSYYMNQDANPSFNAKVRDKAQKFAVFSSTVTRIEDFSSSPGDASEGCYKLMSLGSKDKGQ